MLKRGVSKVVKVWMEKLCRHNFRNFPANPEELGVGSPSKYPCRKCLGGGWAREMCGTTLSRDSSKKLDWWLTDGADIWADFSTLRGARAKVGEIRFDKYFELNWQIFLDELTNILGWVDKHSWMNWQIFLDELTNIRGWFDKHSWMNWQIFLDELTNTLGPIEGYFWAWPITHSGSWWSWFLNIKKTTLQCNFLEYVGVESGSGLIHLL